MLQSYVSQEAITNREKKKLTYKLVPAKQAISDMEEAKGVVKHILVVKFKEDTKEERIAELINEFAELREIIKSIKDFTWGKDVSTANLTKGNTHVFQVTFDSMEDVEAYMAHGAHMAFAQQLIGATDSIILMDYKPVSAGKSKTGCLPCVN